MKNIFKGILCIAVLFVSSCDTETTGDVNGITNFAILKVIGEPLIVLTQGDTYTDAGAEVTLAGEPFPYATQGTANTNVPGVYKIVYLATNDLGYSASATRTVVVLSSAPSIYNLEGSWTRNNGSPAEVVRISDREYTHNNAGGVVGDNALMVTFYNVDDDLLYIPRQENASISGITVESVDGYIIDNDHFNWVLNASGFYGSLLRVFSRV